MKTDTNKRGLRNVATLRTLADQSAPASRTQAVSRFARLENERERLLRELNSWNARKDGAERMLAKVEEELSVLKSALLGAPSAGQKKPRPQRSQHGLSVGGAAHSQVLLEY